MSLRHRRARWNGRGIAALVFGAAVLVGCGGADREAVADMYVEVANEEDFTIEKPCVERVLGAMSDSDISALADAGLDGATELSAQGLSVLNDVANQCIDPVEYADSVVDELAVDPSLDQRTDLRCVRRMLLALTSIDEIDRELPGSVIACTNFNSS